MNKFKTRLIGDTIKVTWISSGTTPSAITYNISTGSETLVGSGTMTSSGNGHYYALYTLPNTAAFYVAETIATVGGFPYKNRSMIKAVLQEVD